MLIGYIKIKSKPVTTKWGDENLFFQNQRKEEDFKIHPDWQTFAQVPSCPVIDYVKDKSYDKSYPEKPKDY